MTAFNTLSLASAVAAAIAFPVASLAVVPIVDSVGKAAQIKCGTTPAGVAVFAVHADKIVFTLTGGLAAADPDDQPALNQIPRNTGLDIKVLDNPRRVADLKGKVLTFLGAADTDNARQFVTINSVEYAMVCPTTAGGV